MREIKFRAWDDELRKMFFSQKEQFDDALLLRFKHFDTEEPVYMQYTGLKDKDGREIYEGDIVEERWDNPLSGGENVDRYTVSISDNGLYKMVHSSGEERWYRTLFLRYKEIKIVGNIYENPELLTA